MVEISKKTERKMQTFIMCCFRRISERTWKQKITNNDTAHKIKDLIENTRHSSSCAHDQSADSGLPRHQTPSTYYQEWPSRRAMKTRATKTQVVELELDS